MSSSGDGDKPAQTGLVDMGDISFYNNPYNPSFNLSELRTVPGSFSEIVLNVTWAQLHPAEGGPLATSAIDSAIAPVNAHNASNGTNVGIKLRVWGGYTAPEWAKNIDGPPITVTGEAEVDPDVFTPQTIGRFWTADYIDAWTNLQNALAATYDSNPVIRGISQTAGAAATDEPFVPLRTQRGSARRRHGEPGRELQAGGYTDAAEMLTLARGDRRLFPMVDGAARLHHERLPPVRQRQRTRRCELYARRPAAGAELDPAGPARQSRPEQPAVRPRLLPLFPARRRRRSRSSAAPNSFQTDSPILLGPYGNWQATVANGVALNAGNIELWDFPVIPVPVGFTAFSPSQVQALAAILAAGSPPADSWRAG